MPTLAALRIHPVKSLRGVDVQRIALDRRGLSGDRQLALVDASGRAVHQRWIPSMARIGVRLEPPTLRFEAAGFDRRPLSDLKVDLEDRAVDAIEISVHGKPVPALLYRRTDVGVWFRELLGVDLRLVRFDSERRRVTTITSDGAFNEAGFDDGYPVSILSVASLEDLNQRLAGDAVSLRRFRPNLVVSGCAAFAEDEWRTISIAGVRFRHAKRTTRCKIVALDPESGVADPRPLQALRSYRRFDGDVAIGSYFLHSSMAELCVGMEVEVLE